MFVEGLGGFQAWPRGLALLFEGQVFIAFDTRVEEKSVGILNPKP